MVSLRARLSIGLWLTLLLAFALQWWLVTVAIRSLSQNYIGTRLEHDVNQLLAGVSLGPRGRPRLDPAHVGLIYQQPFSGHYFRIAAGGHVLRSRSLWDLDLPAVSPAPGAMDRRIVEGPEGQRLLLLTRRFVKQGEPLTITVAEDLTPLDADLTHFNRLYALLSLLLATGLVAAQAGLVRLGLRPLDRLRDEVQRLERGEIQVLDPQAPAEIQPLVGELNRLLSTLAARLERSRQALGNLAHAMKTPLTLLAGLRDRPGVGADRELHATLDQQTEVLRRLVDRELARARLAGSPGGGQRLDLSLEVPRLVTALTSLYREKSVAIETRLPAHFIVPLDREDLLELLGNLLDNACKWARSRVRLTIGVGAELVIEVADDGPGADAARRGQLARRGVRLDEATAGHGLGLAIVRDIVGAYGGTLELDRSPALGGFLAVARLPLPGVSRDPGSGA